MAPIWCHQCIMNQITHRLLARHAEDLDRINNQRRIWLYASSLVFLGIIGLIFTWDWIDHFQSNKIWWSIISVILILCINWWYWTMRVIRILLNHQQVEYDLMQCILEDVEMAKYELRNLATNTVDTIH